MSQVAEKDYWESRYNQLFPNGLTFEQTEQANSEIWKNAYPTREMRDEDGKPEPILIVKQK